MSTQESLKSGSQAMSPHFLAWHTLRIHAVYNVMYRCISGPLSSNESVTVLPLIMATRLKLHLFCRYSLSLSLLLFLRLITFALVSMHACTTHARYAHRKHASTLVLVSHRCAAIQLCRSLPRGPFPREIAWIRLESSSDPVCPS